MENNFEITREEIEDYRRVNEVSVYRAIAVLRKRKMLARLEDVKDEAARDILRTLIEMH